MSAAIQAPIIAFAGKGGVGKTTCAAATALHFASHGRKTLAISTDATPSLSHIFQSTPAETPARAGDSLYFLEIGTVQARQMWEKKFGRDVYQVFSSFVEIDYADYVDFMASVLPGLAEEFIVDYIRELSCGSEWDAVVWDTAPLGQTMALLQTPALLTRHLRLAPRIYTKIKAGEGTRETILDIIRRWEELSAADVAFLRNGVEFNIVTIPEALAVNQLDEILGDLDKYDLKVRRLIINNVVQLSDSDFLRRKADQQQIYIKQLHNKFKRFQIAQVPLFPHEIKGRETLLKVADALY
ncbi:MAG: ArsA family ATPase [Dehalococcoidia bacterium]|nr:ArsA family ATPase [Dehalococcoidia bacterium]MDD5647491.1 ArsA family ATPase [Dehalococcoidia bacterium]